MGRQVKINQSINQSIICKSYPSCQPAGAGPHTALPFTPEGRIDECSKEHEEGIWIHDGMHAAALGIRRVGHAASCGAAAQPTAGSHASGRACLC